MIAVRLADNHLTIDPGEPDQPPDIYFLHVRDRHRDGVGATIDAALRLAGLEYAGKKTGELGFGRINHDFEVWRRIRDAAADAPDREDWDRP